MSTWLLPAGFAIFIWWFSTGIVLVLDGLPRKTFRWSLVMSTGLALGALLGLVHSADQGTVAGAYCAFTCALLLWGWHELTFLTGFITGPRQSACGAACGGLRHAWHALQAILWHEIGLLMSTALLAYLTWEQPNPIGLYTFVVLLLMRASAKLNLHLGVRNLGLEFLPPHLSYLKVYFRRRTMNGLFPVSVIVSTVVTVLLVQQALDPGAGAARSTGLMLVATMLGMGVLEHWLMVVPVGPSALWKWALKVREDRNGTGTVNGTEGRAPTLTPDEQLLHAH